MKVSIHTVITKPIPPQVRGWVNDVVAGDSDWHYWYPWLINLKNTKTFVHLSASWGANKSWPVLPESGYDYYVLSGDTGMHGWAEHVATLLNRPVFVMGLPEVYQPSRNELVTIIPNVYYHKQIAVLRKLVKSTVNKNIVYKASALTSRITQSKVMVFSALHSILEQDCLLSLRNNVDLQNVHNWEPTGNDQLDALTKYFKERWLDRQLSIPNDTFNPLAVDHPAYRQSALNFTQESYHYSLMYDAQRNCTEIHSGPFLTEKTFKCLLAKTAFIPVGQFRSYGWLESTGMKFDYGLDLDFDCDSGNITRLSSLVKLISNISKYSAQDLYEMSQQSSNHNYKMILDGYFSDHCENSNVVHLSALYEKILG